MSVRSQPAQCSPCEAWSRLRGTSAAAKVKARAAVTSGRAAAVGLTAGPALVSPDGDAPPLPQDVFVEQNPGQQDSRYAKRMVLRLPALGWSRWGAPG